MSALASRLLASDAPLFIRRDPHSGCVASVIIPARNEEVRLPLTLAALARQVGLDGINLPPDSYEVTVLLNNCTDGSAKVTREFALRHPDLNLHVVELALPAGEAHVGTARRLLMDTACARLESTLPPGSHGSAILSTDADTIVAPDWIARNLAEIAAGADVVGGIIHLLPQDVAGLDAGTRLAYDRDTQLHFLMARLESLLDPDPADPWPRHLHHFGASLACTCDIYRLCGGLPAVTPLEDVAFVDALRRVGARIRHSPAVNIFTSARFDGRAEVGLSGQLRHWASERAEGLPQMTASAAWLVHRFTTLARLRRMNDSYESPDVSGIPEDWRQLLLQLHAARLPTPRFLELLDSDALIEHSFTDSERHADITVVIQQVRAKIGALSRAAKPLGAESPAIHNFACRSLSPA